MAKVLTMILVVIGHSTYYSIKTRYGGIDYFGENGVEFSLMHKLLNLMVGLIYQFHMPFFMALSGMTYSISYKPSQTLSNLAKAKSYRLLIPFIMVTLFLTIPMKYWGGYYMNSANVVSDAFFGQILLFGNSHLWFVVSLFIITIVFTMLIRKRLLNPNSLVLWAALLVISYAGIVIGYDGCYFGIPDAMKNFIYFSLGYFLYDRCRRYQPTGMHILIGWSILFLLYVAKVYFLSSIPYIGTALYPFIAMIGCVNMVATTKLLANNRRIFSNSIYRSFSKNSYDIYLYSDPFNYVLLTFLILVCGDLYVTSNLVSVLVFMARVVISVLLAYLVIYIVGRIANISSKIGVLLKK